MGGEYRPLAFESAILYLTDKIRKPLSLIPLEVKKKAQEIRIRVNKNVMLVCPESSYFLTHDGNVSHGETLLFVTPLDISEIIKEICNYSVYSFQNQIKNGFITLKGGHRAGICGTAVMNSGEIINIRDVSSINLRIAKEIKGCSDPIIEKLGADLTRSIIAGPPSSGKTTYLRDIARKISLEEGDNLKKVAIIDERGEIAAVYRGTPQCDVGFCDVLNGYPKDLGLLQATRVLSPDVIICDEIGSSREATLISQGLNSGVGVIAGAHAGTLDELLNRSQIVSLLKSKAFKKIVLLNKDTKYTGKFDVFDTEEI